jgi:hypothetical protein
LKHVSWIADEIQYAMIQYAISRNLRWIDSVNDALILPSGLRKRKELIEKRMTGAGVKARGQKRPSLLE